MGISLKNFLEAFINSEKYGDMDTITLNVSPSLYYLQMAVCSATNIIANAISKSEIMVYIDNKPVQNEDYYLLNVSPNINQTSSEFWHKVMEAVHLLFRILRVICLHLEENPGGEKQAQRKVQNL